MQMKKLRLLAVRDVKEELLRELIRRGCVEISELEGEIEGTELEGLLHRESTDVSALRSKHAALVHAVELLDVYAPKRPRRSRAATRASSASPPRRAASAR